MRLIIRLALKNLWLYKIKSFLIFFLLAFGTFFGVVGVCLLRDIEKTMEESITGSVTGDLQVYSNQAKDDLAVFGNGFMGKADNGFLPDFAPIEKVLLSHPNVKAFIPMGIDMALLGRDNEMDDKINALRDSLKRQENSLIASRSQDIRFFMEQMLLEMKEQEKIAFDKKSHQENLENLLKALNPSFWEKPLDEDHLQFLETRIAHLSGEKSPIYLLYMGIPMGLYHKYFPKMYLKEGRFLEDGERGILLNYKMREDTLKNMAARLFDKLQKKLQDLKVTLQEDPEARRWAQDLPRQYDSITSHLNLERSQYISERLKEQHILLDSNVPFIEGFKGQIQQLLSVTDENFFQRYQLFYELFEKEIPLYEIQVGDTMVLKTYTKTGYVKVVPLPVIGVYSFEGLEKADLAGTMNLIDLVSFRELYGMAIDETVMSSDIKTSAQLEEELFAQGGTIEKTRESLPLEPLTPIKAKEKLSDRFDPKDVEKGLAIHGAVILKDKSLMAKTQKDISELFLTQGFDLRVPTWQEASGMVGQFVSIIRMILWISLGMIFLVALIMIANSMITNILGRSQEIGTMRALGAEKTWVLSLFMTESGLLACVSGITGSLLGALFILVLGQKGIPAASDFLTFLFSGPRLYPRLYKDVLVLGPLWVMLLASFASFYASRHGSQIKPVEAMKEKES